ncbi:hypothetical protein ACFW9O_05860 [Streptomyces sp. NPDC059499]|uniref:hypothetical protein n=1 Tax=Streptomyces sp. NPDC059499 TaxID=3346852 RepID=UPI0036B49635
MADARVTINRDHTTRLGNLVFASWWWQVHLPGVGSKSGFARTESRARAKAERAAGKLARTPQATTFRYTLPTSAEEEPT